MNGSNFAKWTDTYKQLVNFNLYKHIYLYTYKNKQQTNILLSVVYTYIHSEIDQSIKLNYATNMYCLMILKTIELYVFLCQCIYSFSLWCCPFLIFLSFQLPLVLPVSIQIHITNRTPHLIQIHCNIYTFKPLKTLRNIFINLLKAILCFDANCFKNSLTLSL